MNGGVGRKKSAPPEVRTRGADHAELPDSMWHSLLSSGALLREDQGELQAPVVELTTVAPRELRAAGCVRQDGSSTSDVSANSGDEARIVSRDRLLSEIPVEITVELGEILISAQELLSLLPGTTIDIAIDEQDPLILRVSGEQIGTGRLRRHGELLALEILSLGELGDD